jgi:putative protease
MRRDALNQLTALRGRQEDVKLGKPAKPAMYSGERSQPVYTVQVTTREQITAKLLKMKPAVLYVPLHILAADLQFTQELARRVKVCAVLPRIIHDGEVNGLQQSLRLVKASGVREALVGNLGHLVPVRECGMAIRGDFGLNLFNSIAVNMARQMELRSACLSFEMTLPQMRDVSKAVPCEIFAYGRLPLMVTENCLIRSRTGSCTCHLSGTRLTDKTGADFPVIKDGSSCRSVLLNGKKLNWLDRAYDLYRLGLWAVRLYFTTENPNEVDQVLASCDNPQPFDPGTSTRGLYLRGLD